MTLYNAKYTEDGVRFTKFTDDLDVESSYITSRSACECPAGHRHTCRHREMLSLFEEMARIDTAWFYDHDNARWYYYHARTFKMMNEPPKLSPSWRRL